VITSDQVRAARAMLRWEQKLLAKQSGVSLATIKRIEARTGEVTANKPTVDAIVRAFTSAGLVFVGGGVCYRLKRLSDRVSYGTDDIGTVVEIESEPLRSDGDGYPMIRVQFSHYETRWIPQHSVQFEPVEGAGAGAAIDPEDRTFEMFNRK